MKELSIQEKAKAYDEALSVARKTHQTQPMYRDWLEKMFPELAESEDARIRKAIKYGLDHVFTNNTTVFEVTKEQCLAWLEKQGEKGTKGNDREIPFDAWSEEDEARFESCIEVLQTSDGYDTINAKWLKSLKDRVQPLQQEWSEKDERMFKNTIALIETLEDYNKAPNGFGDVKFWLKSLKDRYTWKPTELQLECLSDAIDSYNKRGYSASVLSELLEQLKKLREK